MSDGPVTEDGKAEAACACCSAMSSPRTDSYCDTCTLARCDLGDRNCPRRRRRLNYTFNPARATFTRSAK